MSFLLYCPIFIQGKENIQLQILKEKKPRLVLLSVGKDLGCPKYLNINLK